MTTLCGSLFHTPWPVCKDSFSISIHSELVHYLAGYPQQEVYHSITVGLLYGLQAAVSRGGRSWSQTLKEAVNSCWSII